MRGFYPSLAESALAGVNVASGGAEDDPDREKAEHAQNSESKVGGSEQGPGFQI